MHITSMAACLCSSRIVVSGHFRWQIGELAQTACNGQPTSLGSSPIHRSVGRRPTSILSHRPRLSQSQNLKCSATGASGEGETSGSNPRDDAWLKQLPDQSAALYSHSLPCIEAWLRSLGFEQNPLNPELWTVRRADWHAELAMDITDLVVRYLKSGPGNLPRDVERKFSYALSRQDLQNAILAGP